MYMAKTRNSSHIKVSPVFLLVVLFLGGFGVVQIVRAATGGIPGSPGARYDAVQATNFISTESYSFTPMPGMTVPFATSNHAPALVTVNSSPIGVHNLNCGHIMQLKVDGAVASVEIPVLLVDIDARSFTFVTDPVSPGTHTASVEWKIASGFTNLGCAEARSMIVLHQ